MASRTQIVCLCEGRRGGCIDEVFINALMRALKPSWIRPEGNNVVRAIPCGGRSELIARMPGELRACLNRGADTTLMVWADCDHDCSDPNVLKTIFWKEAKRAKITREDFERVVLVFPKDRLENWIQYLTTGSTDEEVEGPRLKHGREAANAAKKLAERCRKSEQDANMPPSLCWSCRNWKALVDRMT